MERSGESAKRIEEWLQSQTDTEGSVNWGSVTAKPEDSDTDSAYSFTSSQKDSQIRRPLEKLELWSADIAKASSRRHSTFAFRRKQLNNDLTKFAVNMTSTYPTSQDLKRLLMNGAELNQGLGINSRTPIPSLIHMAVVRKNVGCVETLLRMGMNPDGVAGWIEDSREKLETPLMLSIVNNDMKSLSLLLRAGADPNIAATTLYCKDMNVGWSERWDESGGDLYQYSESWTSLANAITWGNLEAV
jgi:hypothetical protein